MTELAFPFVAVAAVFLAVIPAVTIASKIALRLVWNASGGGLCAPLPLVLVFLSGPSLGPIVWFISEGVHLAESDGGALACLWPHTPGEACGEVLWFVGALALALALAVGRGVARSVHARAPRAGDPAVPVGLLERVRRACAGSSALAGLEGRIALRADACHAACTRGILSPRVGLCAAYARKLDDEQLAAVLLHERAHVKSRDPLFYLLIDTALALNPLRRLLASDVARFRLAREASCDAAAVAWGAEPAALAGAIVKAARVERAQTASHVAALADDARAIELRVRLLLDRRGAAVRGWRPPLRGLSVAVLAAMVAAPHGSGYGPLTAVHSAVEQAVVAMGLHR